jgi:hypothetical protein
MLNKIAQIRANLPKIVEGRAQEDVRRSVSHAAIMRVAGVRADMELMLNELSDESSV